VTIRVSTLTRRTTEVTLVEGYCLHYAMLENKLGWAPGSIDTILAGREPAELVVKLRRVSPEPRYKPRGRLAPWPANVVSPSVI
jgi:hypothetical protein